jgi:ABC-type multidrug transport system fused ATPase/permease subunit
MNIAKIVERIKNILLTPKAEWPAIAADPATAASIYQGHVLLLAAVSALAGWLAFAFFGSVASALGFGSNFFLVSAILNFILTFAAVFVSAWLADTLAPNFGGMRDSLQALKTVAYSWTAAWVASIAAIVPVIGWLIAIAGVVYAVYLFYLGCQHTLKIPADKAAGYTAVVIILTIVLMFIVSSITSSVAGMIAGRSIADRASAQVEAANEALERATEAAEAAQSAGDSSADAARAGAAAAAAGAAAVSAALGALAGKSGAVPHDSLPADDLKSFLPDTIGGMKRTALSVSRNQTMGMQISKGEASYDASDGNRIELSVVDTGGASSFLALAGAAVAMGEQESETDQGFDRTKRAGNRWFHEEWDSVSKRGEYSVFIADRFIVKAEGDAASFEQIKGIVDGVDLARLESLKDSGAQTK